ncbi:kelch repeat-containing protein [Flavobacterium sp. MC2016-06]|uniref:Kelch repeat-containing protein n=1 Tax=Flavobacterium sp. MC2016-06 TaxID=2676308 RepID=UPI0012BAF8A0|nr:kelch repeat-containing protein [Flavobacterium sp. MC2016-06]MBU3859950.1 carboxypeptidase-like regulatory domain-containing protein [Flavobacterium sp. MC2016-06]
MLKSFIILAFLPLFSLAQNTKGIIVSQKDNSPIDDVNVYALHNKTGTLTNEKGEFSLNLTAKENDTIQLSHIGYITTKIAVNDLKSLNFIISLPEDVENLSGLTIQIDPKKKLKSKLHFEKSASLKYGIYSFGSVLKDDKIYVLGGDASYSVNAWDKIRMEKPDFTMADYLRELQFQVGGQFYKDKLLIYNIKTDTWETSELKFKKRAYQNLNYYNNTIYAIGGKRSSTNGVFEYLEDQIEVFDLNKQTIAIDKTNPHQAINAASFTYKDNIIVMGGSTKLNAKGIKQYSNKVHLYNISSGYWYELADMPTAEEANGVLIDNKIYLIGGDNGKPLSEIQTFDLATEKWETEGKLLSGLERPAVAYSDNTIYFFENRKIYLYNTKSKQLKEYTVELGLKNAAMYYYDNKLYIIGGYIENYYSQNPSSNVYNITIKEFETTQPNSVRVL